MGYPLEDCILKCYEFGIRLEGLEAGSGVFHHSCVCAGEGDGPGTPLIFTSSFIGKAFRNVLELKVSRLPLATSFCGSLDFSSSFFFSTVTSAPSNEGTV